MKEAQRVYNIYERLLTEKAKGGGYQILRDFINPCSKATSLGRNTVYKVINARKGKPLMLSVAYLEAVLKFAARHFKVKAEELKNG